MATDIASDKHGHGNHAILTKVDKLRELVGARVSLPQLVVAGDQSSGKSSVLEGLTGFAFPRDAELCTRYATQITCRREEQEGIAVSIIPSTDANPTEQERVRQFHRTLSEMTPEGLADIFRDANKALGIRTSSGECDDDDDDANLPAFSEHILKIEKLGPNEEHFTVIDVPGIFRKETEGLTRESDIELVRNMVKNYMKDSRTIILAIMPCNVDPATQEILKLAKEADPGMTRTMAVLTKPDLAIERIMAQIAIDHVLGKRSDLTLGYYVVKNRGPDDSGLTLEQGLARERQFFAKAPWSLLSHTGRAGMDNLKVRVRDLLIALIKQEFPQLRSEIFKEVGRLTASRDKMGLSRSDERSQRAYLSKLSEKFQDLVRNALGASYNSDKLFTHRHDLRLITRVVDISERFNKCIERDGHKWPFETRPGSTPPEASSESNTNEVLGSFINLDETRGQLGKLKAAHTKADGTPVEYPELNDFDFNFEFDIAEMRAEGGSIMGYIEDVYNGSRGQDLGTFGSPLIATIFKEQSSKWEPITLAYVGHAILMVHHFIAEAMKEICPDQKVLEQLWENVLLEELHKAYTKAMENAKFLLEIERENNLLTLNHYFNDNLQKRQNNRLTATLKKNGVGMLWNSDGIVTAVAEGETGNGIFLRLSELENLTVNKANAEHVRESMHDVLQSFYKVSRKRFVDVVYQQAINHFLLWGHESPLHIFTTEMVLGLNSDQLDMIAGEDAPVKEIRAKLDRDIENFSQALKVLKGSG